MPTYMKDILDLPDRVMRGDFVLKLSEGVDKPDQTKKHGCQAYTVDREPQEQIRKNFSDLDLSNV